MFTLGKRPPKGQKPGNAKKSSQWPIIVAAVLAVILIGTQLWSNRSTANVEVANAYYAGLPFSGTAIGNPDAPVTVVEFFDYQCPACQIVAEQIVQPVIEKYVASGDVQFIYRFYPILGPESVAAAEASYCAVEQDAFWPYQDALFARKGTGNQGTYSRNNLVAMARQVGMNEKQFTQCLDGPVARAYVKTSHDFAVEIGLQGTPTIFVNDVSVRLSVPAVEQAIEEALASARG